MCSPKMSQHYAGFPATQDFLAEGPVEAHREEGDPGATLEPLKRTWWFWVTGAELAGEEEHWFPKANSRKLFLCSSSLRRRPGDLEHVPA